MYNPNGLFNKHLPGKSILRIILCFLSYWCVGATEAQNLPFHTVTVETGLSNNFVKTIFKDSRGFIWVGTLEGLDRYDGVSFKSYMAGAKGSVNDIAETTTGFLWVATEHGLWKLYDDTGLFEKVPLDDDCQVLSLSKDGNNRLLAGTNHGLYVLSNNEALHVLPDSDHPRSPSNTVTGIVSDGLHSCWLATLAGLFRCDCDYSSGQPKVTAYHAPDQSSDSFSGIARIGNYIYLGTKTNGLMRFDIQSARFSPYIDIGNKFILHVSSDGADRLFVGTDGSGLKVISVKERAVTASYTSNPQDPSSIRSNAVYSFLETDGILWIGTYSTGLSYSQQKPFHVYSFGNIFSTRDKQIRSFVFDRAHQSKIIGTRDGLFLVDEKKGELVHFRQQNNQFLRANIILSIFPYGDKYLVGTYGGGISVFDPAARSVSDFREERVFRQGCCYGFSVDRDNNLWIATLEGVYCHLRTGEMKQYTIANSSLCGNEVYAIKADSKGRVWIGVTQGLCFFDPATNNFRPATEANPSLSINTKVTSIYEDKNTNLWFCTEKDGLYSLSNDMSACKHYSTDGFLPDNSISSVIEDGQGYYWVALHKGLVRCSFADDKFRLFGLSEGLPGLMFNPDACYYDAVENKLWWGSENGLVYHAPAETENPASPPPVWFTHFYINGSEVFLGNSSPLTQSVDRSTNIRLGRSQNNIGFGFVALNYVYPNSNVFETYLEGWEKSWQTLDKGQTDIRYNNLNPGKYIFHVRLADFPNTEKTADIVITRPWYIYAAPLLVLLVILSGYLWYRLRKHKSPVPEPLPVADHTHTVTEPHGKSPKPLAKNSELIQQGLMRLMDEKRPYLDPELKLPDLAGMLQCQPHELSQVLNTLVQQNFADFVNSYRVEEYKRRVKMNEHDKFTLTALSEQCGFSSRSSFFRIFKKITGITPQEYLKQKGIS